MIDLLPRTARSGATDRSGNLFRIMAFFALSGATERSGHFSRGPGQRIDHGVFRAALNNAFIDPSSLK
eukprot:5515912-Alexandrium_andersonii.AAC.1